jgi:hypothetical protein
MVVLVEQEGLLVVVGVLELDVYPQVLVAVDLLEMVLQHKEIRGFPL